MLSILLQPTCPMAPLTAGQPDTVQQVHSDLYSPFLQMDKESVENLSPSNKNSSRVKDLIKKLNEGAQDLSKNNAYIINSKNDITSETYSSKSTDRLTNIKVSSTLSKSTKLVAQDTLDVRKKSFNTENRLTTDLIDLDLINKENKLPQSMDLETMYSLLFEKHSELLRVYKNLQMQQLNDSTLRKDKREIQRLTKTNNDLLSEVNKLQTQLKESLEHNELLEFRLLELEDTETTNKIKIQHRETIEDMSDSGVMSLTTSDDFCCEGDQQENDIDIGRCDIIKQRLIEMCNSVCYCVEDRSTIQQVLSLIRHFECRLTEINQNDRHKSVFPDCLQESGIFEEDIYTESVSEATQTDNLVNTTDENLSTDLTEELRKLTRIREKIEERKVPLVDDRTAKELSFYKDHWQILEKKVEAYESSGDTKIKLLATSIDKESKLSNELKILYTTLDKLKTQNRLLEEEKCEFEEAENDTRLRCQKLESKFLVLAETNNSLEAELIKKSKQIEKLRQELIEVDTKKCEARKHAATMEALVNKYEQRNFELEESEMESKCKLQLLENAWPAIVLWNIWRMVCKHYRKNRTHKVIVEKKSSYSDEDNLEKLRIMTKEKMELEKQVQDLELKENVYQQTLQQADSILSNVEEGYKKQIDELNSELAEKQKLLVDREKIMRISVDSRNRESDHLDRIHTLETEVRDLVHKLKSKEIEKQSSVRRESQLRNDMEQLVNEMCEIKSENGKFKTLLDCEKMKLNEILRDLNFKQSLLTEIDEKAIKEAKNYQTIILKLTKQIDEHDVTNGELKEEVETLEAHIKELRNALAAEKESKERLSVELNQELSQKLEIIDSLEKQISYSGSKNAAEELLFENSNRGRLNFDGANLSNSFENTIEISKLKQLMTCDDCAKNIEPIITRTLQKFDKINSSAEPKQGVSCCSSLPRNFKNYSKSECSKKIKCPSVLKQTTCELTKEAVILEAKNAEKNKIIMSLADELLYLVEHNKWNRHLEIAKELNSIPSRRFAPDFDFSNIEKYLNGDYVINNQDEKIEDRDYFCLIRPYNPIGLHVVRQIGLDGLILAWKPPKPNIISCFELYLNEKFVQRIHSPGRCITFVHPVNLQEPITITMNAIKQDGTALSPFATIHYPFVL
ncbi:early endosome antigen 1 isoform X2 [Daktulosphaira vitifoliae]|uniref:early endosome antigen 1 isoform X2 n=1 Tax=Daktulosphaira vitifoliae TaxID=58002 RepID=UPI0021AB051D|nr:early endosome antigen 1 isoform X2 [Daktulosphaira vitifoliae]